MKIKAMTHIRHDGKSYAPDEEMEISDKAGSHLIEIGAAANMTLDPEENKTLDSEEKKKKRGK